MGSVQFEAKFEALYNKRVQHLGNQVRGGGGGSQTNYQRQGGNQGWNEDKDDGWENG